MKRVVILGAGISGLVAAYTLHKIAKGSCQIHLLEKSDRVGGLIQTVRRQGVLFERGPRALRLKKDSSAEALIDELGLESELTLADRAASARYLLIDRKLHRLSPALLLRQGLLGALVRDFFRVKKLGGPEESVEAFFAKRYGQSFTELLIDPLARGIFGGDIGKLSMSASFPKAFELGQKSASLTRSLLFSKREQERLVSFKNGLARLPERLFEELSGKIEIELECEVQKMELGPEIRIETSRGLKRADLVIAATGAPNLLQLLERKEPFLEEIDFQSLTVASFAFERDPIKAKAFGFLVPSREHPTLLGMSFDSHIFPNSPHFRTSLIFRGHQSAELASEQANGLMRELFGLEAPGLASDHHIATSALPAFRLGHLARLQAHRIQNLLLAGNYLTCPSITACIDHAISAALTAARECHR